MRIAAPLRLALLSAFLALPVGYAQDVDAGPPSPTTPAIVVPAPVAALDGGLSGPVLTAAPEPKPAPLTGVYLQPDVGPALDSGLPLLQIIFLNIKNGNWWGAAAALLVSVVALIRFFGPKLHEYIPDNVIWDKPLWFIFDTKPGGVLLNLLVASAGAVGTALMAGAQFDGGAMLWALVKPVLVVSLSGTALWEYGKDFYEWWKKRKAPPVADALPPPAPTVKP